MGLIKLYKPIGVTPYELIQKLKLIEKYKHLKMSYAGRLDPMAHGLMIILTDRECIEQYKYNNLDKTYEFKLLVGIETDTNDILGIIETNIDYNLCDYENIKTKINCIEGNMDQEYPLFSSKRFKGKPLWYYGKNNLTYKIDEFPKHNIVIKKVDIMKEYEICKSDILKVVNNNISKLKKENDFRQIEILKKWEKINNVKYRVFDICAHVSSGTYIRGISRYISKQTGVPTLCLDIYRKNIYLHADK